MGQDARADGTPALTIADGDPVAIRQQIEATRTELGDTVAALAAKTDVKHQAQERIEAAKQKALARKEALLRRAHDANPDATARAGQAVQAAGAQASARPLPLIAAGAVAAGFLLGRLTKR